MTEIACIVLAAGMGTRMRSRLPKVLHKAGGRTLVGHVVCAARDLGASRIVAVVGDGAEAIEAEIRSHAPAAQVAIQSPARGTGDAVAKALPALDGFEGTVLVLFGADPLMRQQTLATMAKTVTAGAGMAVLGFNAADPTGYGRLLTSEDGKGVLAIREHADCSDAERAITLCNSGVMAFDAQLLRTLLPKIGNDNAKGEYYLTDIVALANEAGSGVALVTCPENEIQGVNTRAELAAVEAEFQRRYRHKAMEEGATLVAPETVYLSADTVIGTDVIIEPHVVIGDNVRIGNDTVIHSFCHIENAVIGEAVELGPYARIRPGTELADGARIGNFVEIKNASIENGAKVNHLSYVGDARVGENANVGAGTITCNYDGFFKHRTDIGAGAFIGSNSALVAPVKIGDGAYVGSGSVVTRDVAPGALAVARGRQENRDGWAVRYNKMQGERKKAAIKKD
ncbi:MAG: bifunctional UDP-N-acetylglucosamine diphosphorylase/glucosamine-1-phosphate N-acetyltransferase GlmU [Anderseniella sp.]|jgi:bifunctional UDP-N-acetylglucosamine pyrophosphorylase/glucosamine-1-phosphate N-acetyltransferase|nr:bifunctional UDP-N-acetylglucosamine diphosphorylase/glucosamine-1-phosphate N-acetyltransferase GlmU [Anderseniella sp.]